MLAMVLKRVALAIPSLIGVVIGSSKLAYDVAYPLLAGPFAPEAFAGVELIAA